MIEPQVKQNQDGGSGRGRLIALEGIDGTGKSTLALSLCEALINQGLDVVRSAEPTQGPHGRRLREATRPGATRLPAKDELALFLADRREHVAQVIAPALAAGRWVVLDRYFYSTMAYQGARGLDPQAIRRAHEAFAPEADLLVLLDLPVNTALERVTRTRGSLPDAFEDPAALECVARIFHKISHPHKLTLDAAAPTPALVDAILAAIASRWPRKRS